MAEPPSITVSGEGQVMVEPDEAQLWIRLTRLESSSEKALGEVAKRSEALQRALDELEIPAADRSTLGITVHEETEWRKDRKVHKGFRAATAVRVRLTDPDLISRLISRATAEADAEVERLHWRVSNLGPVRSAACRRAAEDARLRAEAYAEGLGVPLGPVERVVEAGAAPPRAEPAEIVGFTARSRAESAPVMRYEVDVRPGEREFTVTVDVTFRLG